MGNARHEIFPADPGEHLSEEGACALAHRIEQFWSALGIVIETHVEQVKVRNQSVFAVAVISNWRRGKHDQPIIHTR
jgi:hypothetical protein